MWNDTDFPLGYLITFRCYGTWLHGDERGSTDRFHNRYKSPHLPQSDRRRALSEQKLKSASVVLNSRQRQSVERAIREVCVHRNWHLYVVNVRTNHVHLVTSIGKAEPGRAFNAFKAYATRQLRQDSLWCELHSPWADKGSIKHLWNEQSLFLAIDYVMNGQGGDLPNFD